MAIHARGARGKTGPRAPRGTSIPVERQLAAIERAGGEGELIFRTGVRLHVSSLGKLYFPDAGVTKGDVMRYYAAVAPAILPLLKDRPVALKRYPDGVNGPSFFQQNAPEHVPDGVRVADVETEESAAAPRLIGGDLQTLLYGVQLGAIAVHAWMSRLRTLHYADFSLIDLDPGDETPFATVVEIARTIHQVTGELGLAAALKTSGSTGLHVAIPLPPRTSYERSAALAALVAERVLARHSRVGTTERHINKRPPGSVYVDVQQNAMGKSVVAAYSVRSRTPASVSAPLRWRELGASLRIDAYTVRTMPRRLARLGDLWGESLREGNAARVIAAALRSTGSSLAPTTTPRERRGRRGSGSTSVRAGRSGR